MIMGQAAYAACFVLLATKASDSSVTIERD